MCSSDLTDWLQIALLYHELSLRQPSPVVALNEVVAWSMCRGPEVGLERLEALIRATGGALEGYCAFHLTRADLCRRSGRREEAVAAFRRAAALADNAAVRGFIGRRLAELGAPL